MTMRSWTRQWYIRAVTRTIRKKPYQVRLAVEVLEDRWVPAMIMVNNPTDTPVAGKTDLRQAIAQATTTNGDDTITFDATAFNNFSTPQTITLGGTQLDLTNAAAITGALTIQGPGANLLSVSGNDVSQVFFQGAGATTLSGLTVTGGSHPFATFGGAVFNQGGTLTLTDCTVSGNTGQGNTPNSVNGGGLYNTGTMILTNCTVSGNTASATTGGLFNNGAGTMTLSNCTISGNSSGLNGGLFNSNGATLAMTNCTVSGNSGGRVRSLGGTVTLTNTIVAGNTGGQVSGTLDPASANNFISGSARRRQPLHQLQAGRRHRPCPHCSTARPSAACRPTPPARPPPTSAGSPATRHSPPTSAPSRPITRPPTRSR